MLLLDIKDLEHGIIFCLEQSTRSYSPPVDNASLSLQYKMEIKCISVNIFVHSCTELLKIQYTLSIYTENNRHFDIAVLFVDIICLCTKLELSPATTNTVIVYEKWKGCDEQY